jgi:hypothetical protein
MYGEPGVMIECVRYRPAVDVPGTWPGTTQSSIPGAGIGRNCESLPLPEGEVPARPGWLFPAVLMEPVALVRRR